MTVAGRRRSPRRGAWATAALMLLSGAACGGNEGSNRQVQGMGGESARIRTSTLQAGPATPALVTANPYEGNEREEAEGRRLYLWMNCHGCHGAAGGGGIGPPLADDDWIYGSDAGQIHQSIAQGRPNGMPAYGGNLPDDSIWKIAAFVRTLGRDGGGEGATQQGPADQGALEGVRR